MKHLTEADLPPTLRNRIENYKWQCIGRMVDDPDVFVFNVKAPFGDSEVWMMRRVGADANRNTDSRCNACDQTAERCTDWGGDCCPLCKHSQKEGCRECDAVLQSGYSGDSTRCTCAPPENEDS